MRIEGLPPGARVVARVEVLVQSSDGKQTYSVGWADLDIDTVSVMPPTEYAVRHLWPAFLAAANQARVTLPRLYALPVSKPLQS